MTLQHAAGLWRPDVAAAALDVSRPVAPLTMAGCWDVEPYEVQSRGIAWLWAVPRAILGDVTGLGKTIHIIGTIVLLKLTGELEGRRAVVVCEAGALGQLAGEFATKAPQLRTEVVTTGTPRDRRRALYRRRWDVLVLSYGTMWRDAALLTEQPIQAVWFDESTAFANPETRTAAGARTLVSNVPRVWCATATPVMLGLHDLWSQLQVLGLAGMRGSLFGGWHEFTATYLIGRHQTINGRGGHLAQKTTYTANPQTLPEFRQRLAPFYLRRNEGSADMPTVLPPEDIWVDLTPVQAQRYAAIRSGADEAINRFGRQLQAATTLANIGEADESAKFDWFMSALDNRYVDEDGNPEKVVVYLANVAAIAALQRRLAAAGWDCALITGAHRDIREQERQRFWSDPRCRVALGTRAIEKSLNLQCARWAVMLDLLFNPSRIEQFLGRVKRSQSAFSHVHLDRVMARGTSEEGILRVLRERQGLADFVHQDISDIFKSVLETDPTAARTILDFGA